MLNRRGFAIAFIAATSGIALTVAALKGPEIAEFVRGQVAPERAARTRLFNPKSEARWLPLCSISSAAPTATTTFVPQGWVARLVTAWRSESRFSGGRSQRPTD